MRLTDEHGSLLAYSATQNEAINNALTEVSGTFVTKDSGERQEWETGSRRDTQAGKPRYDLIPALPLRRLADLYARGAEKYGEFNWQKGQPVSRYYASLFRHMQQWAEGDATEDHLAAVAWNAFAIIWTEDACDQGRLPSTFDDWNPL